MPRNSAKANTLRAADKPEQPLSPPAISAPGSESFSAPALKPPGELINEFIKLDDWVKAESARFNDHCKPVRERLEAIRNELLQHMHEQKTGSFKGEDGGTAYKSEIVQPKVVDRDRYLACVLDPANWVTFGNAMLQIGAPQKEAF